MNERLSEFFRAVLTVTEKTGSVKQKYKAILFLITGAALYFSLCTPPNLKTHTHFTVCIFHNITGYPCPACGTIRGLKLFFHFDFYNALMMNPLAVIVAAFMIVSFFWVLYDLIKGKETYFRKIYFMKTPWYVIVICVILSGLNEYWNIMKGL
ncbi:MAG: DUF2752 domain-containing protein [Bacteroidales bacterium]|jgi:hypothetical protein|nr:DUF2752 domain-containing protein [Bacteroidales bacterium]